jgi:hypothetical protein
LLSSSPENRPRSQKESFSLTRTISSGPRLETEGNLKGPILEIGKIMSDFFKFIFQDTFFHVIASVIFLAFTLILFFNKLYKYALIFLFIFLVLFSFLMQGPLGKGLIEKFKGKHPSSLFPSQKEVGERRNKLIEDKI